MNARVTMLFAALAAGLVALAGRLAHLQLAAHDESLRRRDRQSETTVERRVPRGNIFAADGSILAMSQEADSIFVDPNLFDFDRDLAWLAAVTGRAELPADLNDARADGSRFVWILRRAPDDVAEKIRARNARGVGLVDDFRRVYPQGAAAAEVLGFANIDSHGMEGVERRCEALLGAPPVRCRVRVDARRQVVSLDPSSEAPREPASVRLTIDLGIQRELDRIVLDCAAKHSPKSISAIAMDPRTGKIRAVSVYPSFDPNDPGGFPAESRRDRAITDPYEPGSTLKPLIILRAFERGLVRPDEMFDCPGTLRVGPRTIHCHETHGRISAVDVVVKSCNIGAALIGVRLGAAELQALERDLGFGRRTGVDLPGESPGLVTAARAWNDFTTTSVPIGYEIAATPLQLLVAYSAIANGGRRVTPYVVDAIIDADGRLVQRHEPAPGERIYSASACAMMRTILREGVVRGTGKEANVKGLDVAGKTGTTQKIDPATHGYTSGAHIATFAAFAPLDHPTLCVVMSVDDPKGAYYGGAVAAPYVGKFFEAVKPFLTE